MGEGLKGRNVEESTHYSRMGGEGGGGKRVYRYIGKLIPNQVHGT